MTAGTVGAHSTEQPTQFASSAITAALTGAGLLSSVTARLPTTFSGIADDSRSVTPGTLFVAVHGTERDGHDYLSAAEKAGAVAAIVERAERTKIPAFVVTDGRAAAGVAAAAAYGDPASALRTSSR